MKTVNIHEAKTHLSQLINEVLEGQEVVIAKSGKPLISLCVYQPTEFKRQGGQLRGLIKIAKNFDDPLPAELAQAFEGKDE